MASSPIRYGQPSFAYLEGPKVTSLSFGIQQPGIGHLDQEPVPFLQGEDPALLFAVHVVVSCTPLFGAATLHEDRGRDGVLGVLLMVDILDELCIVLQLVAGPGALLVGLDVVAEAGLGVNVIETPFLDQKATVVVPESFQVTLGFIPLNCPDLNLTFCEEGMRARKNERERERERERE